MVAMTHHAVHGGPSPQRDCGSDLDIATVGLKGIFALKYCLDLGTRPHRDFLLPGVPCSLVFVRRRSFGPVCLRALSCAASLVARAPLPSCSIPWAFSLHFPGPPQA